MIRKLLILFLIVLMPIILTPQEEEEIFLTEIGQTVPYFKLESIDGQEIDTLKLQGKIILLNFFATWCKPCMKEMPHLEKDIWQTNKENSNFIVISIGREHSKEELKSFNKEKGFTFLIAPDPERKVYSLFAPSMIPRNYLIDKAGKIAYQAIGYNEIDFKELIEKVQELLKE